MNSQALSLGNSGGEVSVNLLEDLQLSEFDLLIDWSHVPNNVVDQSLLSIGIKHVSPEVSWLGEVIILVSVLISASLSINSELRLSIARIGLRGRVIRVRLIDWLVPIVGSHIHWPVIQIVSSSSSIRTVDGNLVIVWPQSVSVSVWVREESSLQHLVS